MIGQDRKQEMERAARTFDDNIGDLPRRLRALVLKNVDLKRAGLPTERIVDMVSDWCAENPVAVVRIVAAVGLVRLSMED